MTGVCGKTQNFVWEIVGKRFLGRQRTRRDNVSELRPPTGLLFITQEIYEYGEPRWKDSDRIKLKNSEKNLSQCHFVHHKSRMN
jgi:hypothetical protein